MYCNSQGESLKRDFMSTQSSTQSSTITTREVIKLLWHSDRPIAERILVFPVIFLYTLFAFSNEFKDLERVKQKILRFNRIGGEKNL